MVCMYDGLAATTFLLLFCSSPPFAIFELFVLHWAQSEHSTSNGAQTTEHCDSHQIMSELQVRWSEAWRLSSDVVLAWILGRSGTTT